ncbi:unnamed protein product [Brassicogethes aeneus]|uniref:Uncharacterized protein n=1 Tax=Brassicogethes aeneus TaxID=1431903 RepID=A0A9P0FFR3_BRAAE|nr:unnamed protein product [Brassicogethes aeneus]
MEEIISHVLKCMSHTIIVHVVSFPHFSIETFLAGVVCVVHCLLMFEINTLVYKTNAISTAKLKFLLPLKEVEGSTSVHSVVLQKHALNNMDSRMCNAYKKERRKLSTTTGISFSSPQSKEKHCYDRIEQILSITPSQYIRRDKERRMKDQGLKTCIHSLTSLLEQSLHKDNMILSRMSKENIRKNIFALKDFDKNNNSTLPLHITSGGEFPSQTFPSMTSISSGKKQFIFNKYAYEDFTIDLNTTFNNPENNNDKDEEETNYCKQEYYEERTENIICTDLEHLCNENTISIIPCSIGDQPMPIFAT